MLKTELITMFILVSTIVVFIVGSNPTQDKGDKKKSDK